MPGKREPRRPSWAAEQEKLLRERFAMNLTARTRAEASADTEEANEGTLQEDAFLSTLRAKRSSQSAQKVRSSWQRATSNVMAAQLMGHEDVRSRVVQRAARLAVAAANKSPPQFGEELDFWQLPTLSSLAALPARTLGGAEPKSGAVLPASPVAPRVVEEPVTVPRAVREPATAPQMPEEPATMPRGVIREPTGRSGSGHGRMDTDAEVTAAASLHEVGAAVRVRWASRAFVLILFAVTALVFLAYMSTTAMARARLSHRDALVTSRAPPSAHQGGSPLEAHRAAEGPSRLIPQRGACDTRQGTRQGFLKHLLCEGAALRTLRPVWVGSNSSWPAAIRWREMPWPEVALAVALAFPTRAALGTLPPAFISLAKYPPSRRLAALSSRALSKAAARVVRMGFRLRRWRAGRALKRDAAEWGRPAALGKQAPASASASTPASAPAPAPASAPTSAPTALGLTLTPAPGVALITAQTPSAAQASRGPVVAQATAASRVHTAVQVPISMAHTPVVSFARSAEVAAARTVQTRNGVLTFYRASR